MGELQTVGPLSYIGAFGLSIGLIGLSLMPWVHHKSKTTEYLHLLVALLGFGLASLSSGGRIHFLMGFLVVCISYLSMYFRSASRKTSISLQRICWGLFLVVLFILFLYGMIYWVVLRSESFLDIVVENNYKHISLNLYELGVRNPELNKTLTFALSTILDQLSNGLSNFDPFFRVYQPHPLLGGYQFVFISSRFPGVDWFEWKAEIEYCYYAFGLLENVWGTFVREFVVDFGWHGAHLMSLCVGVLFGILERINNKTALQTSLYIFALTWICMTPFYSLTIFRPFQVSFLIVVVAQLLNNRADQRR
ncbi:MAG: hypothetical protein HC936_01995 [Leptolyngbyaceae cyanobacterium SU_3_3]|nr:hypothetical protein [Leptolyngbyaceae cyanobacterium SU_3_3]